MILWLLFLIVVCLIASVAWRGLQRRHYLRDRAHALAKLYLEPDATPNRQNLADLLKAWEWLNAPTASRLKTALKNEPRLEGVDLDDPSARERAYQALVGISPDKSPEK